MNKLNFFSHFWLIFLAVLISQCLLFAMPVSASKPVEFEIVWDASTEPFLEGYEIYFKNGDSGSSYQLIGEVYVDELEDPDEPEIAITNLYNGVIDDRKATIKLNELADNPLIISPLRRSIKMVIYSDPT